MGKLLKKTRDRDRAPVWSR